MGRRPGGHGGLTVRAPRVFVDADLRQGAEVQLEQPTAHYLLHVLRVHFGTPLVLFNGRGGEYAGTLVRADRSAVWVNVGPHCPREAESPLFIRLAQGISRSERMDYALQKAVELGVGEIIPVMTERGQVHLDPARGQRRLEHWTAVIRSACAQCGRNRVPSLDRLRSLPEWLETGPRGRRIVLSPQSAKSLLGAVPLGSEVTLLVGPEGGLTEGELALARRAGFEEVALGPRVLRTETAALAAIAAIQTLWGDLADERLAETGVAADDTRSL
jgi:16S rRNA (uracil1498-N3)-methyltransferase